MTSSHLPPWLSSVFARMATCLDRRSAARVPVLLLGALFASGRRTITSWFRAADITDEFRLAYHTLYAIGRRSENVAVNVWLTIKPCLSGSRRLRLTIDDTPTKRYGPDIEGAGFHHNPTPGPIGAKLLWGHNWVSLAALAEHPTRGIIALPVLASLYVREKDVPKVPPEYAWTFHTKLEMAVAQLLWLKPWTEQHFDERIVITDGAYAKKEFLRPAKAAGYQVQSRLRKDAALLSVPPPKRRPGQRGPSPTYGKKRISLAKRAGQKQGWEQVECVQYGETVCKTIKTFLATYKPAGGLIRVVILKEEDGWLPLFSTNPEATVEQILEGAADRNAHEQVFKDTKEVWGAEEAQVRNIYSNVGAFNVCCWMYSTVEAWAWERPDEEIVDRSKSPWDSSTRRASHQDKRKALQRLVLRQEIDEALSGTPNPERFREVAEMLLSLAV